MREAYLEFVDLLCLLAFNAGVVVQNFDRGREGYLPNLVSKEGKKLLKEIRQD